MEEHKFSDISNNLHLGRIASRIAWALEDYREDSISDFLERHGSAIIAAKKLVEKIEEGADKINRPTLTGGDIVETIEVYDKVVGTGGPLEGSERLSEYRETLAKMAREEKVELSEALAVKKFFYETGVRCLREANEHLTSDEEGEPGWHLLI